MFATFFEDMTWQHVKNKETVKKIKNNPVLLQLFNGLTIGVNVISLESYDRIAEYVASLSEEEAKKIRLDDVFKNVGDYIDDSGVLA